MNLAYTLLNNGQAEQARAVAEKLAASATSEEDARLAKSVLEAIAEEDEWEKSGVHEGVTREFAPPGDNASSCRLRQLRFRRRFASGERGGFAPAIGSAGLDGGGRIDCGDRLRAESGVNGDVQLTARADGVSREGFWRGFGERAECGFGAGDWDLQELDGTECEDLVSNGAGPGIFGRDHADLFLLRSGAAGRESSG